MVSSALAQDWLTRGELEAFMRSYVQEILLGPPFPSLLSVICIALAEISFVAFTEQLPQGRSFWAYPVLGVMLLLFVVAYRTEYSSRRALEPRDMNRFLNALRAVKPQQAFARGGFSRQGDELFRGSDASEAR